MAEPHYAMIAAAYAIAFAVISGMWIAILADRRKLRQGLAQMEQNRAPGEGGID